MLMRSPLKYMDHILRPLEAGASEVLDHLLGLHLSSRGDSNVGQQFLQLYSLWLVRTIAFRDVTCQGYFCFCDHILEPGVSTCELDRTFQGLLSAAAARCASLREASIGDVVHGLPLLVGHGIPLLLVRLWYDRSLGRGSLGRLPAAGVDESQRHVNLVLAPAEHTLVRDGS